MTHIIMFLAGEGNVSTATNFEGTAVEGGDQLKATVEESEEEEEEGEEGVSRLLRATVEELESALNDTRQVLSARDEELGELRGQLERYKQQAAREIANKTRLAQALDQSQNHVVQLEELLQSWQLKVGHQLWGWCVVRKGGVREMHSHVML